MEFSYMQNGDFLIPDLTVDEQEPAYGKYGRIRKQYLKEHRKGFYAALLLKGELVAHLNETDTLARVFISRTVRNMAKHQGIDETLKARDQMAWVGAMNAIKAQAEETALAEIVFIG